MSVKSYLSFLKIGIFASLLPLFFVFSGFLFPFITSKQLPFNILIEILLVVWLVLIIKYPEHRPRRSLVVLSLLAYFMAIAFSLLASADFNLSFWGDLERLLGFFHLLHFLALFLITSTVFKTKKDYYVLFNALILSAFFISIFMIVSTNPRYSQGLLGNRAYLAALILFALFLVALMVTKYKNWWLKSVYFLSLPFFLFALKKADISGSHAGLLAGIFVFLFIFSIFNKNKKMRITGVSVLSFFVVMVVLLFAFRSHPVFDGTYLGRALRDFSSENVTLNTRLISWRAAGQYLADHPTNLIFGVGWGNYALAFNKYFDAQFYNYDRQATYFDRAHNNLVDIIITAGVVGLITYLIFIFFLVYYLFKSYFVYQKNNDHPVASNLWELSALAGLLTAYFVQNLAVFDSFSSYLYLMFITSYIYFLHQNTRIQKSSSIKKSPSIREGVLFAFLGAVMLFPVFNVNVRALKASKMTIDAYSLMSSEWVEEGYEEFKDVFALNSVLSRDMRESFLDLVDNNFDNLLKKAGSETMEEILVTGVQVADDNLSYNSNDTLKLFKASKAHRALGQFYSLHGVKEPAMENKVSALKLVDRAIESSPQRVSLYSSKANILLDLERDEEAIETLNYAQSLNIKMPDAFCQAANIYFFNDNLEPFIDNFETCVQNNGLVTMNFDPFVAFYRDQLLEKENYDYLIKIYDIALKVNMDNIDWLSDGALSYLYAQEFSKARECAYRILELDEEYQLAVDDLLERIVVAESQADIAE